MTRIKLKDVTKDLRKSTGVLMEEAARIKRNADNLLLSLGKQKTLLEHKEEQERALERELEQQKLAEQHAKAWTMPDEDEPAWQEQAKQPELSAPATPEVQKPVAQEPVKARKQAEEPAPVAAKPAAESVPAEPEKPAPKSDDKARAAQTAQQEEAAPKAETPKTEAPKAEVSKTEAPKAEVSKTEAPKADAPKAETQKPQPAVRAAVQPPVQPRPAPAQPSAPAQGQQYGRPANPQGPYGRPANPQGPYGRPANPQGPYGRPANPQGPYGRPANPQGPYGRPANPQGPYGRPATPGAGAGTGTRPPMGGARPGAPAQRPGMAPRPGMAKRGGPELAPSVEKERVSNYDPNKKLYIRQHDPERVAKTRKQIAKDSFSGYDDDVVRGGRRARAKKASAQQMMAPIKIEHAVMTAEMITVKDLTERIGKPAGDILKKLLLLGVMSNINSELDFDTASLVCSEFGVTLELQLAKTAEDYLSDADYDDSEDDLQTRPPVITIMGHVDHGKTSLLDYIRSAHVTQTEAGGITQHIGAYTVKLNGRQITFLDTPGHEAFTAMRARGAQATDIAVLVVAADDGVMPQTVEAINHSKAAGVPIIVAINKMDKEGANPERVKQDLTAYNLVPEEWGGDVIMTPVSAITGEGVDALLEMILLQADMLQLRANPDRMARGVIIEAKLDKSRGPLATVLIQNGTLNIGDNIVAGMASGRVRSMLNDRGERVNSAGPSTPVEVSGFADVPAAGDDMMALEDDHLSRQVAQERRDKLKASRASSTKVSLDNLFAGITEGKIQNLNVIIKADVQGSVEAVKQAIEKLSNDEVKVRVLHSAVGSITQDDINLASAFGAIVIGFNIRPDASARDAAERDGIDIRLYRIIYQAIEDIEKAMKGLLAPQFREVLLGHAQVRSTFHITGAGTVAGCYVQDGKLQRNASVRLLRDNVVIFEGKLSSLKHYKEDVREMAQGFECGCGLEGYNDIKEGDIIECFTLEQIER